MARLRRFDRAFGMAIGGGIAIFGGLGCPKAVQEESPATCTKVGQTCKLAPGLLGVCTEGAAERCAQGPCLVCMSQH